MALSLRIITDVIIIIKLSSLNRVRWKCMYGLSLVCKRLFTRETVVGYTNKVPTSVDNEFDSLDCMQHWTLSKLDYSHNYSPENQIPIYYTVSCS